MKIILEDGKALEIYYNGKYYPSSREFEVNFSEGLRLKKQFGNSRIMESNKSPYNPERFKEKKVAMIADIDTTSGWGNVGLNLVKYSSPFIETSLIGKLNRVDESSVLAASMREVLPDEGIVIHEQPKEEWMTLPFDRKIAIVPFETTMIPQSWVPRINACNAIIVPCRQNIQMMKDSGVTIPIELVHWGVDSTKFHKIDRPDRNTFTFGIMGALTKRKGIDILVDAFFKAFPNEKDIRLLCKTSNNFFLWASKDKRMKIDFTPVTHEELMNGFFKEIDCFVYPTRGEGFGLPILEAMATGVPVIATNWSGPVDFVNENNGWLIEYDMDNAVDFEKNVYKEPCGQWATPRIINLIQLLRHAYEHRDEVKKKGEYAAEFVKNEWLWSHKIKMYLSALEKHLA